MLQIRNHPARVALAVGALFALGACSGRDRGQANTDTAATTTAASGGDVNAGNTAMTPAQELGFVAAVDQAEIEEGRLATTKATNAQVKQFAQRMVTEHTQHMKQTGTLEKQMNVDSAQATAPTDLEQMHQQTMDKLRSAQKGTAFDTTYINAQVQAHQTVLQRLQAQINSSGSAPGDTAGAASGTQLRDHLQKTEQAVQTHLQLAQQIQQSLAGKSDSTSRR